MKRARRWWAADDGRVTAFLVVMVMGIVTLAGLALDGGLALAAKVKAAGQAEAAARAGAQAIDLTEYRINGDLRLLPDQAVTEAHRYLAGIGSTGEVTISDTTVIVTVTAIHRTQILGLVGIPSLTVHGMGSAQPQRSS